MHAKATRSARRHAAPGGLRHLPDQRERRSTRPRRLSRTPRDEPAAHRSGGPHAVLTSFSTAGPPARLHTIRQLLFVQLTVNGLTLGSLYALIALGYSMVYGILKLLNFAHGDVYMVGAFLGYGVLTRVGGPLSPTIALVAADRADVPRRDARVRRARRRHRAVRLPAAPRRAADRAADQRARRLVLPPEQRPAAASAQFRSYDSFTARLATIRTATPLVEPVFVERRRTSAVIRSSLASRRSR